MFWPMMPVMKTLFLFISNEFIGQTYWYWIKNNEEYLAVPHFYFRLLYINLIWANMISQKLIKCLLMEDVQSEPDFQMLIQRQWGCILYLQDMWKVQKNGYHQSNMTQPWKFISVHQIVLHLYFPVSGLV